jgi:F420-dependent oxidoreductase-like protein
VRKDKRVRFAIKTSPERTGWDDMLAVWRAADEIELFESGWVFDHFEPIYGDRGQPCLEGWTSLAALAQATERIRVGVLVTGTPYRHPAVLANMAATVDVLSHGRLELGLGAGWNTAEAEAYGMDLLAPGPRMDRFDEACDVIVGLLTQPTFDYRGEHFTLTGAYCEPKPVQQPHPPICIGGSGERRTLRTVARLAHHWNFPRGSIEEFTRLRGVLAEHCAAVGRDPAEIVTSTHLRVDPGGAVDPGAVAAGAAAWAEAGLDLGIVYFHAPYDPHALEPVAKALAPLVD